MQIQQQNTTNKDFMQRQQQITAHEDFIETIHPNTKEPNAQNVKENQTPNDTNINVVTEVPEEQANTENNKSLVFYFFFIFFLCFFKI